MFLGPGPSSGDLRKCNCHLPPTRIRSRGINRYRDAIHVELTTSVHEHIRLGKPIVGIFWAACVLEGDDVYSCLRQSPAHQRVVGGTAPQEFLVANRGLVLQAARCKLQSIVTRPSVVGIVNFSPWFIASSPSCLGWIWTLQSWRTSLHLQSLKLLVTLMSERASVGSVNEEGPTAGGRTASSLAWI